MRTATVNQIMATKPCPDYTRERVEGLFAGRETITPEDVKALKIKNADKLWALIYVFMDDRERRVFACDCAERALLREREAGREPDERSWNAVAVARRFADGNASNEELEQAEAAAWDARAAAWAAADAAADAALDAALAAAARGASRGAAERRWQVERALEIIRESEAKK